jgi:hypothetical protein
MQTAKYQSSILTLVITASIWMGTSTASTGRQTLWVGNSGVDATNCGSRSHPCRSISQAIENATDGDTIYVGPGLYGDVNADNFSGPGDEHAQPIGGGANEPQPNAGCVVCINKPLHIYSTQGAATTVIANDPQSPYGSTVLISSPGVDFGAAEEGFTLVGSSQAGVTIALFFPVLKEVSVAGNTDNGDTQGFVYFGYPFRLLPCAPPGSDQGADCRVTARILIANNQAIGNGTGFSIGVNNGGHPAIIVRDNIALGAGTGFRVEPIGPGSDAVGNPGATNVQLVANVAMGGGVGFYASDPGQIIYNLAVKNSQIGFEVNPGDAAFQGNSAIGNGGPGVLIFLNDLNNFPPIPEFTPKTLTPFTGNNFIGNDRNRPALTVPVFGISPGPGAHCGVLMGIFLLPGSVPPGSVPPGSLPGQAPQLAASDNYWGSADGPSSAEPNADAVGGACNQDGTKTIATPFSKKPFPVRARQ